jgi:tRNA(Arg) A34 adenosine deaminase TadA
MLDFLKRAARIALPNNDNDKRNFWLGCVGIREDGAVVSSRNGSTAFSSSIEHYQLVPSSHAEGRVLRKLGKNGIIFVARVARKDGSLAMSLPCPMCQVRIRGFGVKKVYYTINSEQYGIWNVKKDEHRVFNF